MKSKNVFIARRIATFLLLISFAISGRTAETKAPDLAIIVHPECVATNLSPAEVTRIFLGEQQFWSDKQRITLLIRAPVSPERTIVLEKIYNMSEQRFRKYWIGKMFKAEVASGPKVVYTQGMAFSLVSAIPGAVTFVPADEIPPAAKVLKIDGKMPGDKGYRFTGK